MPDNVTKPWTPFYFDGNRHDGHVNSPAAWRDLVAIYREARNFETNAACVDFLRNTVKELAGSTEKHGAPMFGIRFEYDGPRTLGQWADEQGMDLAV